MVKYTIHFCFLDPARENLNKLGRTISGTDMPIKKFIANGEDYDEQIALYTCNYIVGGGLEPDKSPIKVTKGNLYRKKMGNSSFIVEITSIDN